MSVVVECELPEKWDVVKIGDYAHTTSGGTPKRSYPEYYGGNVPWVKSGDLNDSTLFSVDEYISDLGLEKSSAKLFKPGTVLVALYGATIGRLSILQIEAASNQAVCGITLPDEMDNKYLFYYLRSIREKLIGQGKGGAQPNISQGIVKDIEVPLAPPVQQKRTVAKIEELFSHIDAGIAALNKAKQLLKQYRQSVLKAAVTGELTKQWREDKKGKLEPASKLLERILKERRQKWEAQQLEQFKAKGKVPKDDKWKGKYKEPDLSDDLFFGDIPESWCVASIDHLACDVRYGSSSKTNDDKVGVPILRMGNIVDGALDYTKLKYLPKGHKEFPDLLLDDGDLVFNRTNSAELVGKTAVFRDIGKDTSLASYLIRVRLINGVEADYVTYIVNSAIGKAWVKSCVSQNVGQANVNGTKLKAFVVPVAPSEEQAEIVRLAKEKYDSSRRLFDELEIQLIKAEKNKQSILASAFSGKLENI